MQPGSVCPITLGDYVQFGPGVRIITGGHIIGPEHERTGPHKNQPVQIMAGAWIGAGAIILPGVIIDKGSVIGAGSVVTKNIPDNVVAAGVPAKVIRELGPYGDLPERD